MVGQNKLTGVMGPIADRGCRSCLIPKAEKNDLEYNISENRRYHHINKALRDEIVRIRRDGSENQLKIFTKKYGLLRDVSGVTEITPALDVIQSRPADPAHSDFAGVGKRCQELLFSLILTGSAQIEYVKCLNTFPFAPGWARLQNPLQHLKSWRMSEAERAMIITPILLRCFLKPSHLSPSFFSAIGEVFAEEIETQSFTVTDVVIWAFWRIAYSVSLVMRSQVPASSPSSINQAILEGRSVYQRLCEAGSLQLQEDRLSAETNKKRRVSDTLQAQVKAYNKELAKYH